MKDKVMTMRFSNSQYEIIAMLAEEKKVSVSKYIRDVIENYIEQSQDIELILRFLKGK